MEVSSSLSLFIHTCSLVQALHIVADIVPNLLLLSGIRVPPHGPDRPLEQVVHRLDTSSLQLGKTEVDENYADVGKNGVQQERAPTKMGHHGRSGFGDAIVDDPVDKEAKGHADRSNSGREDLSRDNVACD